MLNLKVLQVLVYAVLISDGNNYILFFLGVSMEGMSVGSSIDFFKDKDGVYHMVVATSQANATNPAVYMFDSCFRYN